VLGERGVDAIGVQPRLAVATQQVMVSQVETIGEVLVSAEVMRRQDLDAVRAFTDNPTSVIYGPIIVAAWGRKPA
jgi:hypothetical protein